MDSVDLRSAGQLDVRLQGARRFAVRFDNSGNFVHSAPWSVADQGKRDVSHGCINISPTNAKWFFDNFGAGDPIIVVNSVGPTAERRRAGLADLICCQFQILTRRAGSRYKASDWATSNAR